MTRTYRVLSLAAIHALFYRIFCLQNNRPRRFRERASVNLVCCPHDFGRCHSHGVGVVFVRRSFSFGAGGAPNRAMNSA